MALFLLHAQPLRLDLLLLRAQVRLPHLEVVLGAVERLARREAALPELLLALEVVLGLLQRRPRALERELELLGRRARRRERRLRALHRGSQIPRVDLQQELPLLDAVAFVDRQIGDAAHRVGADVDVALRLDLARRGHDRFEVALLDRFGVDGDAGLALELEVGVRDRASRAPRRARSGSSCSDSIRSPAAHQSRNRQRDDGVNRKERDRDRLRLPAIQDARPIASTTTHQMTKMSIVPASLPTNDVSGSIGSSTEVGGAGHRAPEVVERPREQLPSALIAAACTPTANTCLKLAVPPIAALKIANRMPRRSAP